MCAKGLRISSIERSRRVVQLRKDVKECAIMTAKAIPESRCFIIEDLCAAISPLNDALSRAAYENSINVGNLHLINTTDIPMEIDM